MKAEYCLLGIVINNPEKFSELKKFGNIFSNNEAKKLYSILDNLHEKNEAFDKESILDFIQDDKHFSISVFYSIYESEWDLGKYNLYLNIILTKYYKTNFKNMYLQVIGDDYKSYMDIKQRIQEFLEDIKEPDYMEFADIKDICYRMINNLKANNDIQKVKSGIHFFDAYQGGWDKTDYILLGAGEGVGKTSYIIILILKQLSMGMKVGFFTVEMDADKVFQLMACSLAGIDSNRVDNRQLGTNEKKAYLTALEKIYEYSDKLFVDKTTNEISRIRQKSRAMKQKGVDIIYIDYLHMIEIDSKKKLDEYTELKIASREIKKNCKELGIPHFVLACITKEGKKGDTPDMHHIRGNGKIANDVDIGILITEIHNAVDGDFNKRLIEFLVRKNRNGQRGSYRLNFLANMRRFEVIE